MEQKSAQKVEERTADYGTMKSLDTIIKEGQSEFQRFLRNDFVESGKKAKTETHRWMFCHDFGDTHVNDCVCCFDEKDRDICECICHKRIAQFDSFLASFAQKVVEGVREED